MKIGRLTAFAGAGLLTACLLGACGQRGPLVLPKPPEPPPASKAGKARAPSTEATPAPDTR